MIERVRGLAAPFGFITRHALYPQSDDTMMRCLPMQVISRAEAKAQGLKRFYTGEPCKHGHITERYVSNGKCVTCSREYHRNYTEEQKEKARARANQWYRDNRERQKENSRRWKESNRERSSEMKRCWSVQKYATDPEYRLRNTMRNILRRTVTRRSGRTQELLGYTVKELCDHLEKQFLPGMSWDNYGEWHIDHVYPVAQLVRDGETDPAVINCLTNLRPIWASDNFRKSGSIETLL